MISFTLKQKQVVCFVAILRNEFSHGKLWRQAAMTEVSSRGQVAVSQPGPDRSVQRGLEQSQAHRDPAQEPERAARMPQRKRALMENIKHRLTVTLFWCKGSRNVL